MTEGAFNEQTIPRVGLRCTIRFQARAAEERLLARAGKGVIIGQLGLKVEHVQCIQWNQQEKTFDVTLMNSNVFRVAETCKKEAGARRGSQGADRVHRKNPKGDGVSRVGRQGEREVEGGGELLVGQ
ncbi:hypothetical protein NHX12_007470 [Muraenolepis orangiensis]|uniref:Zinc finger CCHC domain-containing protein n=1 Tax=Muraenolepis orangiensis TaxID=630683 RepID=A0A9Q0DQ07_9TELE|nr:hypothetical protein NHX12_007470 [Muraenolepis orangiensis]